MKKQFIVDFKKRDEIVDDLFAVKNKESPRSYKNGTMFTLTVSDKTGETMLNFFGGDKKTETYAIYSSFEVQDVIHIKGKTDDYRGPISMSVNMDSGQIKKVDEFNMEDFMPMTKKDVIKMKEDFMSIISQVGNVDIKRLLLHIFDENFMKEYSKAAAASSNHHNFGGGLLEHVLSMIRIAERVVEMHPELDKDLLIAGCIVHDIGKVKELKVKTAIDYTTEGHFIGHISMGQKIVTDAIESLENFPELLKYKIIHMILSHHGQKDWGSPVEPLLPEAVALHHIDNLDSKIQNILQQKEKADKSDKWLMNRGWPTLYLD